MGISQGLLPEFEQEMKNTRTLLERVPDGKNDYKPHEKSMTLGRLASHVGEIPGVGNDDAYSRRTGDRSRGQTANGSAHRGDQKRTAGNLR